MKQLSIEEKAKAYDEALTKARNIVNSINVWLIGKDSFEAVFPELKESEDERIIGRIKKAVESYWSDEPLDEIIAWLEKQGEHTNFRNKIQIGDKVTRNQDGVLINLSQLKRVAKPSDDIDTEKQGKNNMGISEATKQKLEDNLHKALEKETPDSWNEFLEEQGEQKPADKVEPKFNFRVGQWIVATGKCVYLIAKLNGFNVTLIDTNGDEYVFDTSSLDDAHLWTIQDAKDGDVLANKYGSVFIYAGFEDDKRVTVNDYCYITANHEEFCVETHETGSWYYVDGLNPATKEQRNLLFQKMKEAGYEWDADKKELKKIEQNHAWSEEDEKQARQIERIVHNDGCTQKLQKQIADWLNSLKNRCLPQPKQEWSEEDEQMMNSFLHKVEVCNLLTNKENIWIVNKLKSLKPQKTWKPSKEQIMALRWVLNHIPYDSHKEEISGLLDQIKDL